jgi:mRNA-degrading endonuclease toxin of MazEF toxin-antitoxin module
MARRIARGEIWLLGLPRPDKRRPVLVLSRPSLIGVLCDVFTVPQDRLRTFVGTVGAEKMRQVCRALAVACGCE